MTPKSKKINYHGSWWLACSPDERVPGVLSVNEGGVLSLAVMGTLGSVENPGFDLPKGQFRINGQIEGRGIASLNQCYAESTRGMFGVPRQQWHVNEAVFDVVFDATEPWAFYGASFAIPLLTQWTQQAIVQQKPVFNDSGQVKELQLSISLDSWPLWSNGNSVVDLVRIISTENQSETILEVESRVDLRVRSTQLLNSAEFQDVAIRPMQVLLGLATGRYVPTLFGSGCIEAAGSRFYEWLWNPIEGSKNSAPSLFGFTYLDWMTHCKARIESWLVRTNNISPVLDLYLASLRQVGYAELAFLIVTQALETYHRRISDLRPLDGNSWRVLSNLLRGQLDGFASNCDNAAGWKDSFIGKLNFFNELSLRQRLKVLLGEVGTVALIIAGVNVDEFISAVVDTRNYYTHWDAQSEHRALRHEGLVFVTSRLQALLELLLLREIGFQLDSPAAKDIIRRRISWLPG